MRVPHLYDSETFRNFGLHAFKNLETGKVTTFDAMFDERFDKERLSAFCSRITIVAFNYNDYDRIILSAAIAGKPLKVIKEISDKIIKGRAKIWQLGREYNIKLVNFDAIDLIEVAPGKASLKIYNGRMHGRRMQDLPIDPDWDLTEAEADITTDYCVNDLAATGLLFENLSEQMQLRYEMSAEYGVDLRSKSDAQIAEAVISKRIEEISGDKPERPKVKPGTEFFYDPPSFIKYETPAMKDILSTVWATGFVVSENGSFKMPKALEGLKIKIGKGVYRMGIGGLHSSEEAQSIVCDGSFRLFDRDVASYYPAIILLLRLAPQHLGEAFLKVYKHIVDQRLEAKGKAKVAKKAGNKSEEKHWTTIANSLKIVVNGSFGKLGSKWSVLYAPQLLIQVTITGQLSLLMLIERMELAGFEVISANTDGIVIRCEKGREAEMAEIMKRWEKDTGFETEETEYSAVYSRDVNNYYAVKTDGTAKRKGAYASTDPKKNPLWLQKNPANEIAQDAVEEFLTKGTPLENTIMGCKDIKKFVTVRTVTGGAVDQDGEYLGKAIRWYYSNDVTGPLIAKRDGSTVPRSTGARAMMLMPKEFPGDVDYRWYIEEAKSILRDLGYYGSPTKLTKRSVLGRCVLLAGVM